MQNKSERRIVIDPLLLALKSRRVMVALSALLVGLLVLAVPDLHAVRAELLTLVITLALAVIGGYSVEDAAAIGRQQATTSPENIRDLVKDILTGLIDEVDNGDDDNQS